MACSRLKALLTTSAMVAATATVGTLASDPRSTYYAQLRKPSWTPPNTVFPIVWTALYATIATTSGLTLADLREADEKTGDWEATCYLGAVATNLALNAGWSWVFFRARRPALSAAWAGALAVSSAGLLQRTVQVKITRGAMLAPYAGWTIYAAALSTEIWWRNH